MSSKPARPFVSILHFPIIFVAAYGHTANRTDSCTFSD